GEGGGAVVYRGWRRRGAPPTGVDVPLRSRCAPVGLQGPPRREPSVAGGDVADQVVVGVGQLGELPQSQAGSIAGIVGVDQAVRTDPRDRQGSTTEPRVSVCREASARLWTWADTHSSIRSTRATRRALRSSMSRLLSAMASADAPEARLTSSACHCCPCWAASS